MNGNSYCNDNGNCFLTGQGRITTDNRYYNNCKN